MSNTPESTLPPTLTQLVFARFDKLLAEGEILFEPPHIDTLPIHDFQVATTPILQRKPVLAPTDPGRSAAVGPFMNPPANFIIANIDVGAKHRLIVNKFCVYRPMLVLHTALFALQTDDLDLEDLEAAWLVLGAMNRGGNGQMVIYNCGVQSGSSQGHKHLQIFPRGVGEDVRLWPDFVAGAGEDIVTDIPNVPFKHYAIGIPRDTSGLYVYNRYQCLLSAMRVKKNDRTGGNDLSKLDYNLIMVAEWMVLIPRRTKEVEGLMMGNAATMVGLVWSHTDKLRERLVRMRVEVMKALIVMGVPIDPAEPPGTSTDKT